VGFRRPSAIRSASCPRAESMWALRAQPTTFREDQSSSTATYHPPLGGPDIRHLPAPDVMGRFDLTRARPEVRRHRRALLAVRGDRSTPGATPHRQASLLHHTPGLRPAHRTAFGLQGCGHPPTPITLTCLRLTRFHPRQAGHVVASEPRGRVLMGRRIKAAATYSQHLTQDRHRPGCLVLAAKGVAHRDSLAKKPSAVFNMARAIRQRWCSSCN
jgi:hypothetical protein